MNKISWKAALQYKQLIFRAIIAMDLISLYVCHLLSENLFSAALLHLCIFFFHDTNGLNDLFISPLIFWDGQGEPFWSHPDRESIELPQQKASGGWEPMRVPTMWALRGACCSYPRTRGSLLKGNQLRAFTTSDLFQWDLVPQVTFIFGHF